ncbi:hypothetical protein QFC19_001274 [Naganishia cerealis]|uniref:Uncharacterized protein n=1 Tax=Naganishia cerealis TaxID=610337 RepID=A0ACC2WJ12_9TREE|nr:hypothetical protein QFC19_001274 [Naganishia cerealis]
MAQDWTHPKYPDYILSTRKEWFNVIAVNDALDSDMVYWGTRLPVDVLRKMLDNSLTFGVYHTGPDGARQQVGLARLVTDEVSFAYLTDFYVLHQGKGLGTWVLQVMDEMLSTWPHLRRLMFITDPKHGKPFYETRLPRCHELDLVSRGYTMMEKLYEGAPKVFL